MPNWKNVLDEINQNIALGANHQASALDLVRRKYLQLLHKQTNRNIIAYYSGWLSKPPVRGVDINDEDLNGFMMAIHSMDRSLGLDLILHTPGGSIAATETIVHYLREMFGEDIRVIVPQIAMSAGTMIACSSKAILMSKHSCLGPVDPQINNLPVYGILEEFERAYKEIVKTPNAAHIWGPIIAKYPLSFISQCENAVERSKEFVERELAKVMLKGKTKKKEKATQIVKALTDFRGNKAHDRHLHYQQCRDIGLNIMLIEDEPDLQDLVLTVHHSFMHTLMSTAAYKIIENHLGIAFVRNIAVQK